jgi:diadenosine tetraphosphatase ApaH/serine/threonine PP2A family protein phosphatase
VRILLLSDIHSNLEALEACLEAAPEHDTVVNLGDVVGYGASPNEVIDRCRGIGKIFVRGNHDKAVSGLMDLHDFNPIAGLSALWSREQLTPEHMEWLKTLPQGPIREDGINGAQFVHGSPLDEDEYVVTQRDSLEPLMSGGADITFFGHTHLQGGFAGKGPTSEPFRPAYQTVGQTETIEWALKDGNQYLINPGSVGQPRDGDWRAAFAIYDQSESMITFHRVPYNLRAAQEKIFAANLPQRLATRLAAGR